MSPQDFCHGAACTVADGHSGLLMTILSQYGIGIGMLAIGLTLVWCARRDERRR